jgi:transposase
MHKEAREELRVRLKLAVLEHANHFGVTKTCGEFNVPRSTFYRWKLKYNKEGRSGLCRKKPVAHKHPRKTPPDVV